MLRVVGCGVTVAVIVIVVVLLNISGYCGGVQSRRDSTRL